LSSVVRCIALKNDQNQPKLLKFLQFLKGIRRDAKMVFTSNQEQKDVEKILNNLHLA